MAHARQPPSSSPTQQVYNSPGGLEVVTYVGDFTTIKDADAIVTGEGERFENESFITKALLQISPMEFAQKRHELIETNKQFHKWNIYTSELMPPSQFRYVFHAVMKNDSMKWTEKMKKMYKELFKKADKYHVETLVLPLLGSGRAKVSVQDTVQAVIESITKINDPKHLRKIYLVTLDKDKADQMATQCQYNFNADNRKGKKSLMGFLLGCGGFGTSDRERERYKKAPMDRPIEKNKSTEGSRNSTPQKRSDKVGSMRDERKGGPQTGGDTFNQTSHSLARESEHDGQRSSTYSESHDNPPLHENGRNNASGDKSKSRYNTFPRRRDHQERIEEGRSMRENRRTEDHLRGDAMTSRRQREIESNRQKNEAYSHFHDHFRHDTRQKQFKGYQGETNKTVHTIQTQNHATLAVGMTAVECHERSLNVEMEPGRRASERDTERNEYHQRQRNGNRPTTTEHSKDKGENKRSVTAETHDVEAKQSKRPANVDHHERSLNVEMEPGRRASERDTERNEYHQRQRNGNRPTTTEHSKDKGENKRSVTAETHDVEAKQSKRLANVDHHERSLNVEMEPGRRASERDTERNEYHQRQRNGNRPTTTEHSKDKGENKRSVTAETHDMEAKQSKRPANVDHQEVKDTESKAVNMLDLSVSRNCPICISPITDPKWLDKCGHVFCRKCIDDSFQHFKPVCPSCNMVYGVLTGIQPDGNMDVGFSGDHLPGYEGHGTITITYYFPSGIQGKEHPNPGQPYKGTTRRAYLPDCSEGRDVLKLLKTAFERKLTFTIGRSTTTGQENVVTWNDIHHKTNMDGGPTRFGYPDPGYLGRVKEELSSRGVTKDEKKETPL